MRLLVLRATVLLALTLALSGAARASECPPPDAFDDSTVPGCPTKHPDASAPIDDGMPMMMPPTTDANGQAIPYVEEVDAPPEGVTLTVGN